jgi:hypothetical protein
MKSLFLLLLILFCWRPGLGQNYVSLAPAVTNSPGTFSEKGNIALEIGRQWDVFSLGLDIGKTTVGRIKGRDTAAYLELRPNLNVFQQGKFTNTFTAGIGYIFQAEENLMTELTSGIEFAWTPRFHLNVYFGQYYYSGRYSASTTTFFGVSVMWYFAPNKSGSLIRNPKKDSP